MTHCAALIQRSRNIQITDVQFGLLNPDEVRKQSVMSIITSTLYTKQMPTAGGFNDLRMGTCDRRLHCSTCRHDVNRCPGHFGHLDLAAPMYHVGMLPIVVKILRCICFFCSSLLFNLDEHRTKLEKLSHREQLLYVSNACKLRKLCTECGGAQPKYVHTRATCSIDLTTSDMKFETPEEETFFKYPFTAAHARKILQHMSDDAIKAVGCCPVYARPEWMILTVLQVPPPISRPCITASDGSRTKGQDDVTIKLLDIFKANKTAHVELKKCEKTSGYFADLEQYCALVDTSWKAEESWKLLDVANDEKRESLRVALDCLQQQIMIFMFHGTTNIGDKSATNSIRAHTRTLRLIPARWRGKKGRFRGNLAGKRVNFSSRTVASPAPDYDVDEIGIPEVVATHLSFPERVTPFNIQQLTECVRKGPGVMGGACGVIMQDSDTPLDLSLIRQKVDLQVGWIVERHVQNGDWVLVNRQPSLHRMSIMAHRVRVIADKTFRLPVCDTTPYNADFDGDELNVHVLQTHDARAEAAELMCVKTQMINPENNKPIVAMVQDSLVAVFLMTQDDMFLTKGQVCQLLMGLRYLPHGDCWLPPPALLKPRLWTGKQVFSLLFPASLTVKLSEREVLITRGEMVRGVLCKKSVGTSAGGLVHILFRDYNCDTAANFVSDGQRMLRNFMMFHGFSVGVRDCVISAEVHARVNGLLSDTFAHVDRVREKGNNHEGLVDTCVSRILSGFLTRGGAEVMKNVNVNSNNIAVMVESGAKGSAINISQILSSVGQQSVEGNRIRMGYGNRTLPMFSKNDHSAGARGFVCNSYGTGLTATEYFFHAMGGREGLVDTAVKTAATGYIQRRLSKAQEGLQVCHDYSVRNTIGNVLQFYYGGDGFYPTKLERTSLWTFSKNNADIYKQVVGQTGEWNESSWDHAAHTQADQIIKDRDAVRAMLLKLRLYDGQMVMPVIPTRILARAKQTFSSCDTPELEPVLAELQHLYARIMAIRRPDAIFFTCVYLRSYLTLRNLVHIHQLSVQGVKWVCERIWFQFHDALAEPGEMVGTVGASSIGAPCTQMTLNTFHTAGVLAHTVTRGVPRLKELIDLSNHIQTPSVHIYLDPPYNHSEPMAKLLAASIEQTVLHEIMNISDVVEFQLCKEHPVISLHTRLLDEAEFENCGTFIIRYLLDRTILFDKHLTIEVVAHAMIRFLGESALVMWSERNMLDWYIFVYPRNLNFSEFRATSSALEVYDLELKSVRTIHDYLLDNLAVHGISGVNRVIVKQERHMYVDDSTGALTARHEWCANSEGSNLQQLLSVPGVDAHRTHSNDIFETLEILGIEAAVHQLLTEIRMVLSHDGAYINDRHMQLLVDVMTQNGSLAPVTRHSMSKLGASVYTRASFEQTQDVLTWAACLGEKNATNGVTENIMLGTSILGGTGACDIQTLPHALPPELDTVQIAPMDIAEAEIVGTHDVTVCLGVRPVSVENSSFLGKKRRIKFQDDRRVVQRQLVFQSPTILRAVRKFMPQSPVKIK